MIQTLVIGRKQIKLPINKFRTLLMTHRGFAIHFFDFIKKNSAQNFKKNTISA